MDNTKNNKFTITFEYQTADSLTGSADTTKIIHELPTDAGWPEVMGKCLDSMKALGYVIDLSGSELEERLEETF